MTRTQKFKNWMKDHQEQIATGSAVTVVVAVYGAAIAIAVQQEKAAREHDAKVNAWTLKQNAEGRTVVQLANGQLLAVDAKSLIK